MLKLPSLETEQIRDWLEKGGGGGRETSSSGLKHVTMLRFRKTKKKGKKPTGHKKGKLRITSAVTVISLWKGAHRETKKTGLIS